jgi:hypothetical protein
MMTGGEGMPGKMPPAFRLSAGAALPPPADPRLSEGTGCDSPALAALKQAYAGGDPAAMRAALARHHRAALQEPDTLQWMRSVRDAHFQHPATAMPLPELHMPGADTVAESTETAPHLQAQPAHAEALRVQQQAQAQAAARKAQEKAVLHNSMRQAGYDPAAPPPPEGGDAQQATIGQRNQPTQHELDEAYLRRMSKEGLWRRMMNYDRTWDITYRRQVDLATARGQDPATIVRPQSMMQTGWDGLSSLAGAVQGPQPEGLRNSTPAPVPMRYLSPQAGNQHFSRPVISKRTHEGFSDAREGTLMLFKSNSREFRRFKYVKMGDRTLNFPPQGSAKADWKFNYGMLRTEMKKGKPIKDQYVKPLSGGLQEAREWNDKEKRFDGQFLEAERRYLEGSGWEYNKNNGMWNPPFTLNGQ